ncbi:hypothetical protein [Aureimonas psammosilenae]|uniref:hypothetical protein n=1 Tax=Aureimonas psammosilenae TaxID=2495496 RepID=UPI001260F04E|nr:hypothetical protein [Aureimonas psammosilenae]
MTATETIRALETCTINEAQALERTGAATIVALYRMAILELAPHLRSVKQKPANRPERQAQAA